MEINKSVARQHRRKLWLRRAPKFIIVFLVVGLLGFQLLNYLSNIPRERFARGYKFFERVWLGAETVGHMSALKISSRHEDLKNTKLPVTEIYIKGKRLDRLTEALPTTGVDPEKIKLKVGGKIYSGEARFKGDSINHWAYPNRSWRVILEDGKFYRGMQSFNLNVPRVRTQMANWLGYQLGQSFSGLLVPHTENVHFRLNRLFDGVRLLLEQPNQDFLIRRFLPPGKIFVGDITSEHIYGSTPRKLLYSDPSGWEVRAPGNDVSNREIVSLLNIVKNENNPYRFYDAIQEVLDVDSLAKYMALLELVGSVHVDETHNGKLYFHPHLGRFQPIVWDTVAYMWGNKMHFDMGTNRLFRVLLSNPAFRSLKDKYLWEAMNGALSSEKIINMVENEKSLLDGDVYAFAFKLHANDKGIKHITNREWDNAVREMKTAISERELKYKARISPLEVSFNTDHVLGNNATLGIEVQSPAGFHLDEIRVDGVKSGTLERLGIEDAGASRYPKLKGKYVDDALVFKADDTLLSKRRFIKRGLSEVVSANYLYRLNLNNLRGKKPEITLVGTNNITGEPATFTRQDTQLEVPAEHTALRVWWDPEKFRDRKETVWKGRVSLKEDTTFGPHDALTISPGTTVVLDEGVSLFIDRAKFTANGTPSRPITFRSATQGVYWGTVALLDVEKGSLSHVKFSGGVGDRLRHVRYDGQLAIHGGEVTAKNLTVDGGYISASSGRLTLENSTVRNSFPFTVKSQNAIVRERDTKHEEIPRIHKLSLLKDEGHGTPTRIEREFKFSIRGADINERDLQDVADDIRDALEKHADDRERWNASKLVGADYYIDDMAEDFLFRDIYYDTADAIAYEHQISYRYRNRYRSWKQYKNHVKNQSWPTLWPYRLEFQAKVGRQELGEGFSNVEEARFEFRDASLPFSAENPAPDSPWDETEFMTYFETGKFRDLTTYPAQAVMETLKEDLPESGELQFIPELVLITERFRQHLNIPSEYGSGPNPEQSFIISLDKTRIYEATRYMKYLKAMKEELKYVRKPNSVGSLLEIEVEFERNVSDVLDRRINEATDPKLKEKLVAIRDAFLQDQKVIMDVVGEELAEQKLEVVPANKSKYVQAYELAALGVQ